MRNAPDDILVFRTNIKGKKDLKKVRPLLDALRGVINWNIDSQDCDKVLRIESGLLQSEEVINLIKSAGYFCEELPD